MKIGSKDLDLNNTHIMGILNVTPDSFSDGGSYINVDAALKHALEMINEGAAIIDIGGESTRPGSTPVSADEEMNRVIPVIKALRNVSDIPVSIDTYRAETAEEALKSGADLINDIWGLRYDRGEMAKVIADYRVPCVLMHNRQEPVYWALLKDMRADLKESLAIAEAAGIDRDKIILDPGIGFGKTYEHNLIILNNLEFFNELGYPMLLGCSRKSVIGNALSLPVEERLEGTIVTSVLAAQAHYPFIRVHDVRENKRAVDMYYSIARYAQKLKRVMKNDCG